MNRFEEKEKYIDRLKKNVLRLKWYCKSGELKTMDITLMPSLVPTVASGKDQKFDNGIVRAYSLDRNGWRSFSVDSVHSYAVVSRSQYV